MAEQTPTLKLVKPAVTDILNVNDINGNMDRIDAWALGNPAAVAALSAKMDNVEAPWIAYTPVTNVSLGSGGSISGQYRKIGRVVQCRLYMKIGSNGSVSTPISFSLPVVPNPWTYGHSEGVNSDFDPLGTFCGKLSGTMPIIGTTVMDWVNNPLPLKQGSAVLYGMATQGLPAGNWWALQLGAGSEPWAAKFPNSWFSAMLEYETE